MFILLYPNISTTNHDGNSKYITSFYWYFCLIWVSLNFGKINIVLNWKLEDANDNGSDKDSTHKYILQIETLRRNVIWMCGNKLTFFLVPSGRSDLNIDPFSWKWWPSFNFIIPFKWVIYGLCTIRFELFYLPSTHAIDRNMWICLYPHDNSQITCCSLSYPNF